MTKHADHGLKTLFCTNTLLKTLKGVPSAKMTKRSDLGLKTLFCTNSCTSLKVLKSCTRSAKMKKRADLGLKTLFVQTSALS